MQFQVRGSSKLCEDSRQSNRSQFQQWLHRHRALVLTTPLPAVLRRFGHNITLSSAYRVAVAEGLRGRRRNDTRYVEFWNTINWALPDNTLHRIWGVTRGNLRQRRLRIGAGSAM